MEPSSCSATIMFLIIELRKQLCYPSSFPIIELSLPRMEKNEFMRLRILSMKRHRTKHLQLDDAFSATKLLDGQKHCKEERLFSYQLPSIRCCRGGLCYGRGGSDNVLMVVEGNGNSDTLGTELLASLLMMDPHTNTGDLSAGFCMQRRCHFKLQMRTIAVTFRWKLGSCSTWSAVDMTLDKGASFTQRKVPSIPTIFSWGGSISPDGFLSSILLLVVIIVEVVIVVVTVILVVIVV
ncbi:hypothetical protein Tco_0849016, partial [Tanacetum coccineum]